MLSSKRDVARCECRRIWCPSSGANFGIKAESHWVDDLVLSLLVPWPITEIQYMRLLREVCGRKHHVRRPGCSISCDDLFLDVASESYVQRAYATSNLIGNWVKVKTLGCRDDKVIGISRCMLILYSLLDK